MVGELQLPGGPGTTEVVVGQQDHGALPPPPPPAGAPLQEAEENILPRHLPMVLPTLVDSRPGAILG